MVTYKNILFATLGTENDKGALKQALSIARNQQAKLTLLQITPAMDAEYSEYAKIVSTAIRQQMDAQLTEVAAELGLDLTSLELDIAQQAHEKPAVAIIKFVLFNEHDLLIKTSQKTNQRTGFKAVDMELLRKCPCPVWLCKPIASHRDDIKVAVAIDAFDITPAAAELSVKLLKIARAQADACDGNLRIISNINHAFRSEFEHNVFLKLPEDKLQLQAAEVKGRHLDSLNNLIVKAGIQGQQNLVQLEGSTDEVIPDFVEQQGIDILVMGTIARSGFAGVFIGNTAENIIQQLDCSLLAVKPSGFVSPVKTS